MAAAGVCGAVVAVSLRRSSAPALISGDESQASSSLPSASLFFGQRCRVSSSCGELRPTELSSATSGAWAYSTCAEHIRENFASGADHSGKIVTKTLYDCLGVSKFATSDQIRAAYRSKARQVHPDVVPDSQKEDATKTFMEVQAAYAILSNRRERADYDMKLSFRHGGPVTITPSQWGFIAVPASPDDPSGSITFRGRKNYESDFFS